MSFGFATQNGVSVSIASIVSLSSGATEFSPASLFSSGEVGAWYDPSDYSTMFQDSAGTTPVTAVEQPVGLLLDKSGRGNHATQATSASRPTLRARYNLLTYSEQFNNAAWANVSTGIVTVTANSVLAPDGTMTADTLTGSATNTPQFGQNVTALAVQYTFSFWAKASSAQSLSIFEGGTPVGVASLTTDWQRFTFTHTFAAGTRNIGFRLTNNQVVYAWGADLRPGASAGTYQRIAAATDYDTTGFLPYLAFDGTDDSLSTGSINFSATDKMTVWAGVTQSSNANYGTLYSLSPLVSDPGSMLIWFRSSAGGGQIEVYGRGSSSGTAGSITTNAATTPPQTSVLTAQYDIAQSAVTDEIKLRQNGASPAVTGTNSAGSGNFANAATNIGRYNASNYLNGRIYSLIVRGAQTSADQISSTESWVAAKTGVVI